MENLNPDNIVIPFRVSARTARLIGRENVATSKGAIIELVKNAYDADSKVCIVYFDNKYSHRKGRSPNAIRNSYLDNLSTEDDFNKILEFFETNPNASNKA